MVSNAPHRSEIVSLRFLIGERTLATVQRRLRVQTHDLETLLSGAGLTLPPLPLRADGMLLRSAPADRLGGLRRRAKGLLPYVYQRYPRHYAQMEGDFEAYLAGFSARSRSTLKRKARRFAQLSGGRLDVRAYRTPAEMAEFHALACRISQKTYQERLLDCGLPDGETFRAAMLARAAKDQERGFLLFLAGEPVSYLYTPIRKGCAIYSHLGYDPALAAHSPGTVLQLEAMARLFAERSHRFFDFTEGDGQHKRLFATGSIACADVLLLRPTFANRLLIGTHRRFHGGVAALGDLADRCGARTRLRRLLRGGPAAPAFAPAEDGVPVVGTPE